MDSSSVSNTTEKLGFDSVVENLGFGDASEAHGPDHLAGQLGSVD